MSSGETYGITPMSKCPGPVVCVLKLPELCIYSVCIRATACKKGLPVC